MKFPARHIQYTTEYSEDCAFNHAHSSIMMESQDPLSTQISQAVVVSPFPTRLKLPFAPRSTLSCITKDSINRHFLSNLNNGLCTSHSLDEQLIEYILREDVKELFGSCVAAAIPNEGIILFMRRCQNSVVDVTKEVIFGTDDKIKRTFPTCNTFSTDNFMRYRYLFRAPVLSYDQRHTTTHIHEDVALPIVKVHGSPKHGGFATVHEVTVHTSFLDKTDPIKEMYKSVTKVSKRDCKVAIKVLSNGPTGWQRETTALTEIGSQYSSSHLVDVKAMIMQDSIIYLIFPWANGGNLIDFWEENDSYDNRHKIAQSHIRNIVEQFLGLSEVLNFLHNFGNGGKESYRHGDLKPENILVFRPRESSKEAPGTWKIADLGLAKFHNLLTGARNNITATSKRGWGTTSYKPPEAYSNPDSPTSRLFDIWSMGCILLQLITWLVYGMGRLGELTVNTKGADGVSCFWAGTWAQGRWHHIEVHEKVLELIKELRDDLGEQSGHSNALLDLLTIVQERLLVIPVEGPRARNKAGDLYNSVQEVHEKCERNRVSYWALSEKLKRPTATQSQEATRNAQEGRNLDGTWTFPADNEFPESLFGRSEQFEKISTAKQQVAKLCSECKRLDIGAQAFWKTDSIGRLRQLASSCEFCKIRLEASLHITSNDATFIFFNQVDSNLQLNGRYPPVLTINRGRGVNHNSDTATCGLQIGLPRLPEAGTTAHFEILRHWLLECDHKHTTCKSTNATNSTKTPLPTRVIDVESEDPSLVKLHETEQHDAYEYLALSHPWGPQSATHFCTVWDNLAEHKKGIKLEKLPATFQDAVRVTRGLGHRYLWIDSICIIQGKGGDFNDEAKRMEDVFSQAYCVLAASSATGQHDGFLKPRNKRKYLTFREDPLPPIYISEFIDNFQQHVLGSHLNQRGWVLQERVLAKRTIYFTEKQTYWECGGGVRCETMTRMHNQLASFLGDPNFPKVAIEANRGGKIRLYQDLYVRYSRLSFSHCEDRPVAIAGLEQRLISSLDLRGGFGILDDNGPGFFRRSLMWRRAQDEHALELIEFKDIDGPASKTDPPPTWSWMAYKGAIEYLELPFDHVEWEEKDIISPWATNSLGTWSYTRELSVEPRKLRVTAREFDATAATTNDATTMIIDTPTSTQLPRSRLKCVILGRLKDGLEDDRGNKRHFVLLVEPKGPEARGARAYVRAGVGVMPGRIINLESIGADGNVF